MENRGSTSRIDVGYRFLAAEDGAVTVDWVVLTAAIVLLGMAAGFLVTSAVPEVANKIDETLQSMTVVPD